MTGKRPRITPGDWCHSGDSEKALRRAFLMAVEMVAPEVVSDLRDHVLPIYQEPFWESLDTYNRQEDALTRWADGWHINYPWVVTHARQALDLWMALPEMAEFGWMCGDDGGGGFFGFTVEESSLLVLSAGQAPNTRPATPQPQHMVRGWDPTFEPREVASDRLHQAVDAMLDYMEQRLVEMGFERTPDKRVPDHFLWLARRVCLLHSCSLIAKDERYSEDSVMKRSNELARTLVLEIPGAVRGWSARTARETTNGAS